MPIQFSDFLQQANATRFGSRDIVVDNARNAQSVRHGRLVFSSGKDLNKATMEAFRQAVQNEYGFFGLHAFDTVVGTRAQLQKSLRACDVKQVFSQLEPLKQRRLGNELERQMATSPELLGADKALISQLRAALRPQLAANAPALEQCTTPEEVSALADQILKTTLRQLKLGTPAAPGTPLQAEAPVASDQPMGLAKLQSTHSAFGRLATSVEDYVRKGWLGAGMRVNFGTWSNPAVFEQLKANGVEPGFIYHNDWSAKDSRVLAIDIHDQAIADEIDDFLANSPRGQEVPEGASYLEKGLFVGRAHPAGIAFAAEYVLSRELDKLGDPAQDSPLLKAVRQAFPGKTKADFFPADGPEAFSQTQKDNLAKLKKECFVPLRNAVMAYGKQGGPHAELPVFRHFTDRHILKLDYNEGDRTRLRNAPGEARFKLPERVVARQGSIYRAFRLTTADEASIGAASEALANDLTRLLGVPAQELSLVRGKYSDGHPKLMLEAKFAEGYKDLDGNYINDGCIIGGLNAEPLGRYKAIFLALADRDAVGSHGQNKGFVSNPADADSPKTFFAIDPGHSLEGNGKDLEIRDNLSFTDTKGSAIKKRFRNFSIFDDDTRFNKLQGVLKLRELRGSGKVTELFDDYRAAFDPEEQGISRQEKNIRKGITEKLSAMQSEFLGQIDRMTTVCADQLRLYDALDGHPDMQRDAIETIENLEKFTSPTTQMSAHNKVRLQHLAVIEKTRIPWTARKDGDALVYTSAKPLPREMRGLLAERTPLATFDAQGKATIRVPIAQAQAFFDTFSEQEVMQMPHKTSPTTATWGTDR